MTTNSEYLQQKIDKEILSKIRNLDGCLRFDGNDCDNIFFYAQTNSVFEVSFKYGNISIHSYRFLNESSKILKTHTSNRLLCVDWVEDEFIILRHVLEQHGLTNYKINKIDVSDKKDLDSAQYYELIFPDEADFAMFEVYFQILFDHDLDKEEIEKIRVNGLLK